MKRVGARTVILTPREAAISDRFDELLDEGHSCVGAIIALRAEGHVMSAKLEDWLIR